MDNNTLEEGVSKVSVREELIRLDRIGGDAEFLVYHDGEKVIESFFISTAPVRGFEKLVLGKGPLFVIEAVMRICGICHAAHGIAAAEAIEDAIGIMPPINGRIIREAIGLINRVQSHLMHLMLLIPDIYPLNEEGRNLLISTIKVLNKVNELMTKVGGAPTHPPNITVGGISKSLKDSTLNEAIRITKDLMKDFTRINQVVIDAIERSEGRLHLLRDIKFNNDYLASHLFYGDKYGISVDDVKVMRYEELRGDIPEFIKERNTTLVATYKGNIVEVGPRARMVLYKDAGGDTLLSIQLLRMQEVILSLERVDELLSRVRRNEPVRTPIIAREGVGIGVYEAPRGTLIHKVELDSDGRIVNYQIIVPTMFNIPIMEKASLNTPPHLADLIPRIYDPCIPCTTHLIRVG